jgi:NitT/TauT family transport system permease protein
LKKIAPLALGLVVLAVWELLVRHYAIPVFVLPGPSAIAAALVADFPSLLASLWTTLWITLVAFVFAVIGGVGMAVLFSQSRA